MFINSKFFKIFGVYFLSTFFIIFTVDFPANSQETEIIFKESFCENIDKQEADILLRNYIIANKKSELLNREFETIYNNSRDELNGRLENAKKRLRDASAERANLESKVETLDTEKKERFELLNTDVIPKLNESILGITQELQSISIKSSNRIQIEKCLNDIQSKLSELASSEGTKKWTNLISFIFAGSLLGLIIISFFFIIYKKEGIYTSTLSGEQGLRYVALFLIVVSIIILGLFEIFGANELSALLGSIAGYVLGRSSDSQSSDSDNK